MKEKVNGFNDHLHKCTFLACLMSANKLFMKKNIYVLSRNFKIIWPITVFNKINIEGYLLPDSESETHWWNFWTDNEERSLEEFDAHKIYWMQILLEIQGGYKAVKNHNHPFSEGTDSFVSSVLSRCR